MIGVHCAKLEVVGEAHYIENTRQDISTPSSRGDMRTDLHTVEKATIVGSTVAKGRVSPGSCERKRSAH